MKADNERFSLKICRRHVIIRAIIYVLHNKYAGGVI